jgi:hypothetical protein
MKFRIVICENVRSRITAYLAVILWFTPFFWTGLSKQLPPFMNEATGMLFRVSGVFETSPELFRVYYVQVRSDETSNWETVSDQTFFRQPVMGNRNRLQALLSKLRQPEQEIERQRLAEWIGLKLSTEGKSISQVRFLSCTYGSDFNKLEGVWQKPSLAEVGMNSIELISEHEVSKNEQ